MNQFSSERLCLLLLIISFQHFFHSGVFFFIVIIGSPMLVCFFDFSIHFFGHGFDFFLLTILFSLLYIMICQVAPPAFRGGVFSSQKVAIMALLFTLVNMAIFHNSILWKPSVKLHNLLSTTTTTQGLEPPIFLSN